MRITRLRQMEDQPKRSSAPLRYSCNCELCGRPVPRREGRGRPAESHDQCKQLAKLLAWTESEIETVRPILDAGARRLVRSRLLSLANLMNAGDYIGDASAAKLLGCPAPDATSAPAQVPGPGA
jgi:hypothetical protein